MSLTEIIISDGLLKQISIMESSTFHYCAVTKLHIDGIPYIAGSGAFGQPALKGFLNALRYYSANLFCAQSINLHESRFLEKKNLFFVVLSPTKSILSGSVIPLTPHIAYFDLHITYCDRNLEDVSVILRRDKEDVEFCSKEMKFRPVCKPVEIQEVQWIMKIILGLKSVRVHRFSIQKRDMQIPWTTDSLNLLSLEK